MSLITRVVALHDNENNKARLNLPPNICDDRLCENKWHYFCNPGVDYFVVINFLYIFKQVCISNVENTILFSFVD